MTFRVYLLLILFVPGWALFVSAENGSAQPAVHAWLKIDVSGSIDGSDMEADSLAAGLSQRVDMDVAIGDWVSAQLHSGGTYQLLPDEGYGDVTGTMHNWEAVLHDPSRFWLVGIGDFPLFADRSQVLALNSRMPQSNRDSNVHSYGKLTFGRSAFSAFFVPPQDGLDLAAGAMQFSSSAGRALFDASAGWGRGLWLSAGADMSLGSSVIVYGDASYNSDTRFIVPTGGQAGFNTEQRPGLQGLLGASYAAPWLRGTLFLEVLADTAGHPSGEWQDFSDIALDPQVYGGFLQEFTFFSQSALYSALHWELDSFVIDGLEGGASIIYSFPRDVLTQISLGYETIHGVYVNTEARGVLPFSEYEFLLFPETVQYALQLGWVYRR